MCERPVCGCAEVVGDEPVLLRTLTLQPPLLTHRSLEVWWKQDRVFREPRCSIVVQLLLPQCTATALNAVFTALLPELVSDKLRDLSYPAGRAGYSYALTNSVAVPGLKLTVSGCVHPTSASLSCWVLCGSPVRCARACVSGRFATCIRPTSLSGSLRW